MSPEWAYADFHFLRPIWLLFVPYALWLHLRLRRAYSAGLQWQGAIDPDLLEHLTVSGRGRPRLRPYQLMTLLLTLTSIVVAGPTWQRETTPFTEDHAPLVIAIELTPSMLCTDQQPTRLDRARFKLRDLLERRRGARTAVIGYAGSAHVLLPFTDDTDLLEVYLDSLDPGLMPSPGDAPDRALELAASLLRKESIPGTLLFLTDGIDADFRDDFGRFEAERDDQLILLAFGGSEGGPIRSRDRYDDFSVDESFIAPPLDRSGLAAVANRGGGQMVLASLDASDLDRVMRRVRRHLIDVTSRDENLVWKDEGYPLVWAVASTMLVWFRRGWTVQW